MSVCEALGVVFLGVCFIIDGTRGFNFVVEQARGGSTLELEQFEFRTEDVIYEDIIHHLFIFLRVPEPGGGREQESLMSAYPDC
jgi:hypothetical protein